MSGSSPDALDVALDPATTPDVMRELAFALEAKALVLARAEAAATARSWTRPPSTQAVVAFVVLGLLGTLLCLLAFVETPAKHEAALNQAVGAILALGGMVVSHYFGSSKSGTEREDRHDRTVQTILDAAAQRVEGPAR